MGMKLCPQVVPIKIFITRVVLLLDGPNNEPHKARPFGPYIYMQPLGRPAIYNFICYCNFSDIKIVIFLQKISNNTTKMRFLIRGVPSK